MAFSRQKKIGLIFACLLFLCLTLGIIAHFWVKKTLVNYLREEIPKTWTLNYQDLHINLLKGVISLDQVALHIASNVPESTQTTINIQRISASFKPLSRLFNPSITLVSLHIEQPRIHQQIGSKQNDTAFQGLTNTKLKSPIRIKKLQVTDGLIHRVDSIGNSPTLHIKSIQIEVDDVATDTKQLSAPIPFTYTSYALNFQEITARSSPYEWLELAELTANTNRWDFNELTIRPIYERLELSKYLTTERDHLSLSIPKMRWNQPVFTTAADSLKLRIDSVLLESPQLIVFRDKLVADDTTTKPLFAEQLRNLPLQLDIPLLNLKKGKIDYTERIDKELPMEAIHFADISAMVSQLGNVNEPNYTTTVRTQSKVMGKIPMKLHWDFKAADPSNHFNASGSFQQLEMQDINAYLKANLQATGTGTVNELYFTIAGNDYQSHGDMKMNYENLVFNVHKTNQKTVNKILTAIGKLFIKKNSKKGPNGYRFGAIQTERDRSKSFFNYLWLNVRDGIVSTLTGNGEPSP